MRRSKPITTENLRIDPPQIAFPNHPDAYGNQSSPRYECVSLEIKFRALSRTSSDALDYCTKTAEIYGSQVMSSVAVRIDPIFLGSITDNPWQFLYSNASYFQKPAELLAILYACGWNRKTTPERLKKYISRRSKFARILLCNRDEEASPWKIRGAKKLVSQHYFYDGLPFLPTMYFCGVLDSDNINFLARYVSFMEKYKLMLPSRIRFIKSHIRYTRAGIKGAERSNT